LLSYISALGVHKHAESLTLKEREFCRNISIVLQYVTELLNGTADISQLDSLLQTANHWEESLEELQHDATNRRAGLIYNIAHVSRELLIETNKMKDIENGIIDLLLLEENYYLWICERFCKHLV